MLVFKFRRIRGRVRRLRRLIYMSPAEARFVELMGGKIWRLKYLRSRHTGFPFTIVVSLGQHLKDERFQREVRFGIYWVDFANDVARIIEIDGRPYHMDVVADMEREIYIKNLVSDAKFLRIPAARLYNSPARVQSDVLKFLNM